MKVSIIIPTLFPPIDLSERVGLLSQDENVLEVIVVANGAAVDLHQTQNVKVIQLEKNQGFTGASNAGARVAAGDLLLFLNDDCVIDSQTLDRLLQFLVQNPSLAATQPVVRKLDGSIEHVGFVVDTQIGKATPITSIDDWKIKKNNPNYGLSATCLLIKNEVFKSVGMFDESFHSYLEDVDLAIKFRKKGYAFSACPEASVSHAHMATSQKMGIYKQKRDMVNWWRLIIKYPNVFPRTPQLFVERGRNLSGFLKKALSVAFGRG